MKYIKAHIEEIKKLLTVASYLAISILITLSCSKSDVGYLEVRNKTNYKIENVNWGGLLNLGEILPGEENGTETELAGDEYINLEMDDKSYRSKDKISVDARTSATFIIKDTTNLVRP